MATTLTTLNGLAVKGIMARKLHHEALVSATMSGDKLTIAYASQRRNKVSPRKWQRVNTTRFVLCERKFTPDGADFWWQGVQQFRTSYTVG
jgi:hypothetical protein